MRLDELRAAIEALPWYEQTIDDCVEHRPDWDWGPDKWAHLNRADVLSVIDDAQRNAETAPEAAA